MDSVSCCKLPADAASAFATHAEQAYKCTIRYDRVLLQAVDSDACVLLPIPDAVVAVDASGSMTYNATARVQQARLCLSTVEELNGGRTAISKFGVVSTKVSNAASFLIDNDVGTAFVAAANGLAASYEDLRRVTAAATTRPPPVNAVFVTDCEQVSDKLAAKRVFETLPLQGAVVFIGVGDKHTISSLMSVAPERCEGQTFYIKVPERPAAAACADGLDVPVNEIRDALLSVQIEYTVRDARGSHVRTVNVRVLKGADYLFPAGVQVNDIFVCGKPLSAVARSVDFVDDDAVVMVQELRRYSGAATLNVVRAYNFALSKLELEPHRREVMPVVVDLATRELAFIAALRRRVLEENVSAEEIAIARTAIGTAACGAASAACMSSVRSTVRRMRYPSGVSSLAAADDIVEVFRTLRDRICRPPDAASVSLANQLLNAMGRGRMSGAEVSRLLGKAAQKQDAELYATIANDLQVYEDAREADGGAATATAPRYASPEADVLDGLVEVPVVCTATFESAGCMVAVGSLKRSLAGAMDPLVTCVLGVSREPYKIQAVRLCGEDGFRASAGFANGIVGVFPGDSVGAAVALKLIASNMATGDWNTVIQGLRPLLALLAGVVCLHKQPQTPSALEFAETLVHGFLGVAARTQCRVLGPNGTADLTTPVVSGLTACRTLLLRAFAAPMAYAGSSVMSVDYWLALEFAMRYAAARLGENYAVPARPAEFTAVLIVSGIARSANFFVTPRASKDDRAEFDAQKRAIDRFVKFLPLYVGQQEAAAGPDEDDIRYACIFFFHSHGVIFS